MRGRDKFKKYELFIDMITRFYSLFPKKIQKRWLEKSRKIVGVKGLVIRYALLKNLALYVGNNVSIHPDVYLFNVDKLSIGDNVSIHPMSYIEAYGGVTIGNDVSIAHGVTIMSVTHNFSLLDIPIKDQSVKPMPIVICDNVWVGAKTVILGDNKINEGAILGAGTVVTKDVRENAIVAGVPSKIIKIRF